jgi:hypothetical protein
MAIIRRAFTTLFALALPLAVASAANAAVMDTTLADPPGVYFGTGNTNAHFVTNSAFNIELGLGTVKRFLGPVTPDAGTSTYHVLTGTTSVAGKTGADWGFVYSLNTNLSGTGSLTLANIIASLCVQDVGLGTSSCFNPLTIPDNAHAASSPLTTAQNSEALQFLNSTSPFDTRYFDPGFDINANNTYIFTLNAYDSTSNQLLNSVQMTDIAGTGAAGVPEPGTLALFGLGLLGLGFIYRQRRNEKTVGYSAYGISA